MRVELNFRRVVTTGLMAAAVGVVWHVRTIAQSASSGMVTVFDHEKVGASFTKAAANGGNNHLWSRTVAGVDYDVHTHSRDSLKAACKPEGCSHTGVTGVMYVISGAATIVVGGKARAARPDKFGGKFLQGGQSQRVSKGDVFIVPPDTIHWYTNIEAPFRYFEVPVPKAPPALRPGLQLGFTDL